MLAAPAPFTVQIPRLQTARLLLREHRIADFDSFAEHAADAESRVHNGGILDRVEAIRRLHVSAGGWVLRGRGWWTVEALGVGPVGLVGVFHRDESEDVEMGWTVFRPYWRRGYAAEAALAARDYAVNVWGVERITAHIGKLNTASLALAARLGLHRVGESSRFPGEDWEFAYTVRG